MAAKQQKIAISIPVEYTEREKIAIAQDIIDFIVKQTKKGKDKNNENFPRYSDEYVKSLDFNNAGKSRGKVNLQLSGDMLAALKVLDIKSSKVIIGYEAGTEENAKAEGNILGTYGQKKPTGKARDFLGITTKALTDEILRRYPLDKPSQLKKRTEAVIQSGEAAQDIISELEDG